MQIESASCPECAADVIVEAMAWRARGVKLRCPGCGHRYTSPEQPADISPQEAANAHVPIEIWEP